MGRPFSFSCFNSFFLGILYNISFKTLLIPPIYILKCGRYYILTKYQLYFRRERRLIRKTNDKLTDMLSGNSAYRGIAVNRIDL